MSETAAADTANERGTAIRSISELADHLGELPHPTEEPGVAYYHPGKRYDVLNGTDTEFTITGYYPDGPCDGVVEFQMNGDGIAVSESGHANGGVQPDVLEPYEPEEPDRGVVTVTFLMKQVREFQVGEQDGFSYSDAYWNHVDSQADTDE